MRNDYTLGNFDKSLRGTFVMSFNEYENVIIEQLKRVSNRDGIFSLTVTMSLTELARVIHEHCSQLCEFHRLTEYGSEFKIEDLMRQTGPYGTTGFWLMTIYFHSASNAVNSADVFVRTTIKLGGDYEEE